MRLVMDMMGSVAGGVQKGVGGGPVVVTRYDEGEWRERSSQE